MALLPVLLCVLFIRGCRAQVGERMQVNGKVGGSVTITASHDGQASEILWKIGGDKYGEVDAKDPFFYRNPERSTMDLNSGTLTINHLTKPDTAEYTAELLISGTVHYRYFTLHVFDEVTNPSANCTNKDGNYTLYCTHPSPGVTLRWKDIDNCQTAVCTIPDYKENVTCIAHNQVSEKHNTTRCSKREVPVCCVLGPGKISAIVICCVCGVVAAAGFVWWKKKQNRECQHNQAPKEQKSDKGQNSTMLPCNGPNTAGKNTETPSSIDTLL